MQRKIEIFLMQADAKARIEGAFDHAFNLQGGQQRGWYFNVGGKAVTFRPLGNLDCNDGEFCTAG